MDNNSNKINDNKNKKFFYLTKEQWGWVSTISNGLSVIVQMYTLFTTFKAQSFSMNFIWLMTLLNFTYFLLALLQRNIGFALATFFFVIYNLCVVYVHHCGKDSSHLTGWFHSKITTFCKPKSSNRTNRTNRN